MTKLTGAALDRAVAQVLGLKSVHNCEKWETSMNEFNKPTPTPEDEAFNDSERTSRIRQEIIRRQMEPPQTRNNIIEEVALHVEKLKGFGKDTTDSLAVYIREMKK